MEFSQDEFHSLAASGWKLPTEQQGAPFFWTSGPQAQLRVLLSEVKDYNMQFQCRANSIHDLELRLNTQPLDSVRLNKGRNVHKIAMPESQVIAGFNQIDFVFKQVSTEPSLKPRIVFRRLDFSPEIQSLPSDLILYPNEKRMQFQGTLSIHFLLKTGHNSHLSFRHRTTGAALQQPTFSISVENHMGKKLSQDIEMETEKWRDFHFDLSEFENQIVKVSFLHVSSRENTTEIKHPKLEFRSQKTKKRRVLLLGLDGADWNIIKPLLKQKKLPNLQRLIETGVSAPLRTIKPWYSPVIWTTIATGKGMDLHGIKGFVQQQKEKERVLPNSRLNRKCLALWNILSAEGFTVGLVGPWVTWPAEAVNGYILSDRMYFENLPATTFPPELKSRVFQDFYPQDDQTEISGYRSLQQLLEPENLSLRMPLAENIRNERLYIQQDQLKNIASTHLISTLQPDFSFIYMRGPDVTSHFFWQYYEPDATVAEEEVKAFGELIPKNYIYQDQVLGNLLQIYGKDLTTIIVSDHGMGRKSYLPDNVSLKEITGDHRMYGILIMSGEGIQENVWLEACSVLDVAPTILHLMGLPVGKDMEGQVISEALTPRFRKQHPARFISTYESLYQKAHDKSDTHQPDHDLDEELLERLRSLGYIK